jgi:ankyrin repeat protein
VSEALQALYEGDADRARSLLDPDEELGIFDAAAFGRIERLRWILNLDSSISTARSPDGFTPLHLAVFGKQEEAARVLIQYGADVNALSTGEIARVRPLGTAVFVRSPELTAQLLDAGADANGRDADGFTPLHSAARSGDVALVRLLLGRGADPELEAEDGTRAIDLAEGDEVRALLTAD